jgi:hypothetical protein
VRPDATTNPTGYARWLAAARTPARKLRNSVVRRPGVTRGVASAPPANAGVTVGTLQPWTGAVLKGSYHPSLNPTLTRSYALNEASWNVPAVTPSGYGVTTAVMAVWNGLDNSGALLQAIVDVNANSTAASYGIHRQCFATHGSTTPQGDEAGITFQPKAGDEIYAQEWWCDANGAVNMSGGYACTHMTDLTQNVIWECDQANSTSCASYQIDASTSGRRGVWAEFVVENQTSQSVPNDNNWPAFAPISMKGSALVVLGDSTQYSWVDSFTDPNIEIAGDWTAYGPSRVNVDINNDNWALEGSRVEWNVAPNVPPASAPSCTLVAACDGTIIAQCQLSPYTIVLQRMDTSPSGLQIGQGAAGPYDTSIAFQSASGQVYPGATGVFRACNYQNGLTNCTPNTLVFGADPSTCTTAGGGSGGSTGGGGGGLPCGGKVCLR